MGQIFFTQNPTCPREERDSALALTGGLAWEGRGGGTPAAASLGAAPGTGPRDPSISAGKVGGSPLLPLFPRVGVDLPLNRSPRPGSLGLRERPGEGPRGRRGGDAAWSPRVAPGGVGSRRPGLGPGGW